MKMRNGRMWECQNYACQREIPILVSRVEQRLTRRCSRGSSTKRAYLRPEIRMGTQNQDLHPEPPAPPALILTTLVLPFGGGYD
jgi:hypothetical protein